MTMENVIQPNRKYYNEITIAKGMGILLVVLGHAMKQTGVTDTAISVLLQLIYSFHMPLFFVLSGFVSIKILRFTEVGEYFGYIKSRAFRLLIPYFVVGILYMPLKYFLSRFARNPYDFSAAWKILLGENPNTTLWFLYTLFWVSVLALVLVRRTVSGPVLILTAVLSAAAFAFSWEIRVLKYLFFFLLGLYLREHYERVLRWGTKKWCAAVLFLLFAGGNVLLYGGYSVAEFMTSVAGRGLCILLALWLLAKGAAPCAPLKKLGDGSMDVYILSDPVQTVFRLILWNILGLPNVLVILFCFAAGVIVSYVAAVILRRWRIFRVLLFGEYGE